MQSGAGIFVIYHLYRSQYSYLCYQDAGRGKVQLAYSNLENAILFYNYANARHFLNTVLPQNDGHYIAELESYELPNIRRWSS